MGAAEDAFAKAAREYATTAARNAESTWLSTSEVAEHVDRCEKTVRRWIEQGYFPNAWRVPGGRWHVPLADVVRLKERTRARKSGS